MLITLVTLGDDAVPEVEAYGGGEGEDVRGGISTCILVSYSMNQNLVNVSIVLRTEGDCR